MAFRDDVLAACLESDIPRRKQRLRVGGSHAQRLIDETNEMLHGMKPDKVLAKLFGLELMEPPMLTVESLKDAKNKYLGRLVELVDDDVLEVF